MELDLQIVLQPKQIWLLEACRNIAAWAAVIIGWGGARGGAKSGGIRRIAIALASSEPGVVVWIMRRVWDDLNKNHVQMLQKEFPHLWQFWRAQDRELRLPNGSSVFFLHAGDSGRLMRKARGPEAAYIFVDQAEEFTQEELEGFAGSNRAPGKPARFAKRIFAFNPGGPGTAYLKRVFHDRIYNENEDGRDFDFMQAYGWDNYEWFRGAAGAPSEHDFYNSREWNEPEDFAYCDCPVRTNRRRFEFFLSSTDFGDKLNKLPQAQRIGELMGNFTRFAGQYFSEVWERGITTVTPDQAREIMQPWWVRWMATDWGFSHYCANGWACSGFMAPEAVTKVFGVPCASSVRVIVVYREAVVNRVTEPDLARLLAAMTPLIEKEQIAEHFIGHDAFSKEGAADTVVEQMDRILIAEGLKPLQKADINRVDGWRFLFNAFGMAVKMRKHPGREPFTHKDEDAPVLLISESCPDILAAVPMLIAAKENPQDVEKIKGSIHDDVGDMVRYLVKSHVPGREIAPQDVQRQREWDRHTNMQDKAMAMLKQQATERNERYIRRARRG